MASMKAVQVKGDGTNASDLFIGNVVKPSIENDQVLVQVKAFGINRMDILQRQGRYPPPAGASTILGVEFAGDIIEIGKDVTDHKIGDRVYGLTYGGCYSQFVATHSALTNTLPDQMDYVHGAAICENWYTAFDAIRRFHGGDILIHAGASGVSLALIQLARLAGANRIFATAGTDEKCHFVQEQVGATKCFNYKAQDFSDEILKATDQRGVDFIVDYIGKDYWEKNIKSIAKDGQLVVLAFMSGSVVPNFDLAKMFVKRMRIEFNGLRSRTIEYQSNLAQEFAKDILPRLKNGSLKIQIAKVFPWDQVSVAHEYMQQSQNIGKIVCTID